MKSSPFIFILITSSAIFGWANALAFDHQHSAWDVLLRQHVVISANAHASRVDYAGFKSDHVALSAYLAELSVVSVAQYVNWSKSQKLAFLINAYNAFTIELILSKYPLLDSIKELGNLLKSPWQIQFFSLLGERRSLDDIEHQLIREPGIFDESRIHFAVVCASVGCPMLSDKAYVADRLEMQLQDGLVRFLSDRTRNYFDAATRSLRVSKLFDWYAEDFKRSETGSISIKAVFGRHADILTDDAASQREVTLGNYRLSYLDYDWSLNDVSKKSRNE